MFPNLEFIKTMLNGLRSRIEKVENGLLKRIEKVEDWAVSEDQVTQTVADYFVKNPIVESDPTVPAWAKEPEKPTYTAKEIGAQPDMYVINFDSVLGELAGKTVVYVAYPGSSSPIPSGRYPVLLIRSGIDRGQASIVAYDAAGKTWAGGANFMQGTIGLVERTLTASDIGAIPAPATASVGQTVVVKAVDEGGNPTEWAPATLPDKLPNPNALTFTGAVSGSYDGSKPLTVDIPSGGGGSSETWNLIEHFTVENAALSYEIPLQDGAKEYGVYWLYTNGAVPKRSIMVSNTLAQYGVMYRCSTNETLFVRVFKGPNNILASGQSVYYQAQRFSNGGTYIGSGNDFPAMTLTTDAECTTQELWVYWR